MKKNVNPDPISTHIKFVLLLAIVVEATAFVFFLVMAAISVVVVVVVVVQYSTIKNNVANCCSLSRHWQPLVRRHA
jgi:hypothetical protein